MANKKLSQLTRQTPVAGKSVYYGVADTGDPSGSYGGLPALSDTGFALSDTGQFLSDASAFATAAQGALADTALQDTGFALSDTGQFLSDTGAVHQNADEVAVADTGGLFTGTSVERALQELASDTGVYHVKGGTDVPVADGGTGASDVAGAQLNLMGWRLGGTWTHSTDVGSVDFTGLSGVNEFLIEARGITMSASARIALRISTDGGSSYLAGTEYVEIAATGVETAGAQFTLHNTAVSGAARSGFFSVWGNQTVQHKLGTRYGDGARGRFAVTADIDAIRLFPVGGGNFTTGDIRIWIR